MAPRLRRSCPTFWRDAHTSIFIRPSIPVARFAAFCRCPSLRPWSLWDSVFWALPEYGGAPYKAWLWHRLLGGAVSENGTLRHGDGTHGRSDRCRRAFVLPILQTLSTIIFPFEPS